MFKCSLETSKQAPPLSLYPGRASGHFYTEERHTDRRKGACWAQPWPWLATHDCGEPCASLLLSCLSSDGVGGDAL